MIDLRVAFLTGAAVLVGCATSVADFAGEITDAHKDLGAIDGAASDAEGAPDSHGGADSTVVDSGGTVSDTLGDDTASGKDTTTMAVDTGVADTDLADSSPMDSGVPDTGTADTAPPMDTSTVVDTGTSSDGSTTGCTTLADFESSSFPSPWNSVVAATVPTFGASAAHDGAVGLVNSGEWFYRLSPSIGKSGDRLTLWVRESVGGSGRVYIGFSATTTGAKSFVIAPNTSDIRFQDNPSWGYTELNTTPYTFTNGKWYKAEIVFGAAGLVTGRLYDSDGVKLLASVTHTYAGLAVGGAALRSFGDTHADTFVFCPGP